ncbi:MAG: Gfo/Idh/MocA family oxidoreductase [Clostridia bacterium]|nr:Gfo/Idh/MocA family oxidoreductase [Clostridia bacterium]MBO4884640.1 Gfo/Idh/MocA family oxidoreductase [Clostridia bacterium]MBR4442976.1 Gfo/Idh/MocA family oxidoreductase [Clostridia bacterium]
MIRTVIIGYGRNGSTMHAGPLERYSGDFQVAAVCDIDAEARDKAQKRFACPVYEDYHAMLAEIRPELAVIVTRSHQHAQMTVDCLMAGVNVLVTKPWATNVLDAQRMIAAQKVTGKMLLPWLPARFGSDLRLIRDVVERGDIGRVFEIRRSVTTFGLRCDWQTEHKYGGGYLLNWGPHLIDQPLQLVKSPITRVYGSLRQIINPGDGEDNLRVIAHTDDGVTVMSEFLIAAGPYPSWVIQGDRGTIIAQGDKIHVHRVQLPDHVGANEYRSQTVETEYTLDVSGNIYGDEYEIYPHIARALRGEEAYFVPLDEALRLSRIIDAARLSSRIGQEVFI